MAQTDYNPYNELVVKLQQNLSLQDNNPDKVVKTMSKNGVITSCLFEKNGKEFFEGTKNDGRRHLMMQFSVDFRSEEYKKFRALKFYRDFTETEDGVIQVLSIDCGDNAKRTAEIFISVMTCVFGIRFSKDDMFATLVGFSKKTEAFWTILKSERRLFSSMSFSFIKILFCILYFTILVAIGLGLREYRTAHKKTHPKLVYVESARMLIAPREKNESIEWLKKAAEQGDVNAQDALAQYYYRGINGIPVHFLAVKWWKKAAEQGNMHAMNSLAICYAKGQGVGQDEDEAVRLWKKAAEMGNSAAETNLKIHKEGNGYLKEQIRKQKEQRLQKSYRESNRNFSLKLTFTENKKAAERGDADAQYNLGQYYEIGVDVDEDEKTAFEWYRKAARQGLVEAQDALGRCYHNGIGVERNDEEAVKWWLKAAEQGNVEAQNSLAICYADGKGVEQDDEEAVKWWQKAIEQGNKAARDNLDFYEKRK